jgi:glycosyltransferase involved in cell wall biosynthesis
MNEYMKSSDDYLFFRPIDLSSQEGKRFQTKYMIVTHKSPLRIAHAPNHQEFKGTRYLVDAIESLRREGVVIELVMVEGVSNEQALKIYRSADVIFDQCLIGFHGYFTLKAMALGKPVMCFIRKPDEYLLCSGECPIINTNVDSIKEDLRRLVEQRDRLEEIGRCGRQYIEKYNRPPYNRSAVSPSDSLPSS